MIFLLPAIKGGRFGQATHYTYITDCLWYTKNTQCSECTPYVGVDAIVIVLLIVFLLLQLLLLYHILCVCVVPELLLHGDHAFSVFFVLLQNLELPLP